MTSAAIQEIVLSTLSAKGINPQDCNCPRDSEGSFDCLLRVSKLALDSENYFRVCHVVCSNWGRLTTYEVSYLGLADLFDEIEWPE